MQLTETKTPNFHYFRDEQSRLQGEYKEWNDDGKLGFHCHYFNGIMHGECKEWHNNGNLWVHTFLYNGKYHGEYKEWKEDGTLVEHTEYFHDTKKKNLLLIKD